MRPLLPISAVEKFPNESEGKVHINKSLSSARLTGFDSEDDLLQVETSIAGASRDDDE